MRCDAMQPPRPRKAGISHHSCADRGTADPPPWLAQNANPTDHPRISTSRQAAPQVLTLGGMPLLMNPASAIPEKRSEQPLPRNACSQMPAKRQLVRFALPATRPLAIKSSGPASMRLGLLRYILLMPLSAVLHLHYDSYCRGTERLRQIAGGEARPAA
jgi:hypothetical protein